MKQPKDKRTKAYKDWKKKFDLENENKSQGLGDTIEKITVMTGIKKVAKFIAGEDCGCDDDYFSVINNSPLLSGSQEN